MTDPNPNLDPDEVDEGEQASVAAAAIAGFTLAQFAFGALIQNGILPKDQAEHLLRQAIETHATAGPGLVGIQAHVRELAVKGPRRSGAKSA